MKARISQLHKTEAQWNNTFSWIPEPGELVVYDPDENHQHARIKVGDGMRTLQELDFFIDSAIVELLNQIKFESVNDGGRIKAPRMKK
jgi:hypothetical protein